MSQQHASLIPQPNKLTWGQGAFIISAQTVIVIDPLLNDSVDTICGILRDMLHLPLPIATTYSEESVNVIFLTYQKNPQKNDEYYSLNITLEHITVAAAHPSGFFNALHRLRQLLPAQIESSQAQADEYTLPALTIEDEPQFGWRGLLIDPARNFYRPHVVKQIIDLMSLYGLNRLHLHLTDDQGWRFVVPQYPSLHAGQDYYTNEDISDIIKYAQERQVLIIPEIDMPGHTTAATSAYPEFSCQGIPVTKPTRGGNYPDIMCPGNDATYDFISGIINSCAQLFPGPYIHIGGDEAVKTHWHNCPKCQQRMSDEQLSDIKDLEHYFIKRVEGIIQAAGKQMIGWDEIFELDAEGIGHEVKVHYPQSLDEDPIAIDTVVQSWRDPAAVAAAAEIGHKTIVSNHGGVYISRGNRALPLEDVYQFQALPSGISQNAKENILGIESCLWETPDDVESWSTLLLPRLCAVAELAWTQANQLDLHRFKNALINHRLRWDYMGLHSQAIKWVQASFEHPDQKPDSQTLTLRGQIKNQSDQAVRVQARLTEDDALKMEPTLFEASIGANKTEPFTLQFEGKTTWDLTHPQHFTLHWTSLFGEDPNHVTETWTQTFGPEQFFYCTNEAHSQKNGDPNAWNDKMPFKLTENIRFGTCYDDHYVYTALIVEKDPLVLDPQQAPFAQDSVEIRFDARSEQERFFSDGEFEFKDILPICVSPSTNTEPYGSFYRADDLPSDVRVMCKTIDGAYFTEVAVPHHYFDQKQQQSWSSFRLNISVNVHKDGQSNKISWRPLWRSKDSFPWSGTFYRA